MSGNNNNDKSLDNVLFSIRDFYEVRNGAGIMVSASARDNRGVWQSIKIYVPAESQFEDSAVCTVITDENTGEKRGYIKIPKERNFDKTLDKKSK